MKKKSAAICLGVIACLIALSIEASILIRTVSDAVAERIRRSDAGTVMSETPGMDDELKAVLLVETESEEDGAPEDEKEESAPAAGSEIHSPQRESAPDKWETYYDEPVYASQSQEDAANKAAYQDMAGKLLSLSEAALTYRENFNPVYDELKAGLMNTFISGREGAFYEGIGNYCFGHYNTSYQIRMVRFDAMIEDTPERQTVILEFFTAEDLKNESYVPDLKLCTYNKKNEAFVFFSGARR